MDNKLRNPSYTSIANSNKPKTLALHRDSHTISKIKPKIRIIHIFAPEIIKTDAENFRELVQKLTGKPSEDKKNFKKKTRVIEESSRSTSSGSGLSSEDCPRKELLSNGGFWGLDVTMDRVIKEEVRDESCGGYLGGFSDLEGFISEINGGFPLFPLDASHNMQGFEQYHQHQHL
ncbi:VQ motif-containing protein 25-like [Vicia villosa]|uniref:VQ motif-containing protein 25-like n=1 Tax=Vicia villosa TaxID=3911 RepID=UPI00273C4049|nr:VQ motif-containing protein 25-like [Vicia villosa]